MSNFTPSQQNALNNLSPVLLANSISLGDLIDSILTSIASGNLGIKSNAWDVDALAKDGNLFAQDTGTTAGLTFGYMGGRFHNGLAVVTVAAGTILLAANQTNYVEVDRAGTVSTNTSGFTSGRFPLYQITTGSSTISVVTNKKCPLVLIGTAGVVGTMLSTMAATKSEHATLGDLSATFVFRMALPPNAGTISAISFLEGAAVAADDTNYWKWKVVNKGTGGAGTNTIVDDTNAANSTKATGGAALSANIPRALVLGVTLTHAAGDVLEFTVTKTAAPTTMTGCAVRVDSIFTG